MVAFCDIKEERAKAACEKYGAEGAKYYTDYKELLKDGSIDVVHVCTPNVSHCPITCDAFAAGKHVMCEKPMAHNTEAAQKMMDAWKASGKKFTIGYQNRFRTDTICLHKACEAGDLGDRLTPSAAVRCPPGACSPTSPSRAAAPGRRCWSAASGWTAS